MRWHFKKQKTYNSDYRWVAVLALKKKRFHLVSFALYFFYSRLFHLLITIFCIAGTKGSKRGNGNSVQPITGIAYIDLNPDFHCTNHHTYGNNAIYANGNNDGCCDCGGCDNCGDCGGCDSCNIDCAGCFAC